MMKSSFFKNNRKKIGIELNKLSIIVLFSKDRIIKGDTEYFDFCDENMFYFSGIEQVNTKFILHKDSKGNVREYLFLDKKDIKIEVWEGIKLDKKYASKISKIDINDIYLIDDFNDLFDKLILKSKYVYLFEDKKYNESTSSYEQFIKKVKSKFGKSKKIINLIDVLKNIREIKSSYEISEIKKAITVTNKALIEVCSNIKKKKYEYEIEATLSYIYKMNNGVHAFHPIVANRVNACTLHYVKNDSKLKKGSLVLIDTGCEINNYKADITRTIPLSGKFTSRQKKIYRSVLNINKFAISMLEVGKNIKEYHKEVFDFSANELIKLKLINQNEFNNDRSIAVKYLLHSIGHFLGLTTHDLGNYDGEFKAGQIITVEPGIYIQKEKIGIRIEDDILVGKKKCINLTKDIIKEISDIEKLIG